MSKIPGFRSGKAWKKVIATVVYLFVAFCVWAVATADPKPKTATAPVTQASGKTAADASKISASDKELLKKSYASFDSPQRTQFAEIEEKYAKLTDAEKADVKVDFERLSAEKKVVVAKALAEETKKAQEKEDARKAEEAATTQAKIAAQKSEAKTIPYKTLARTPDDYKGASVTYTGKVIQVQEEGNNVGLRVNVTKNSYGYEDTMFVVYDKGIVKGRVLEDDIITFWGTSKGLLTYKTVLGAEMTIPQVLATIVEVN